jgi:hypothetical protein
MVPTDVNLDWSFRPLIIWLRITTGINLMEQNVTGKKTRVYQLLCLLINFLSQFWVVYHLMNDLQFLTYLTPGPLTLTKVWNVWIDYLNWAVAGVGEF